MSISKKIATLVLSALAGILMLAGISQRTTNAVFDAANYANDNTVPSLVTRHGRCTCE